MTTLLRPAITYTVDPWDPGYGVAFDGEPDGAVSRARLDLAVEQPAESWCPVTPPHEAVLPPAVLFLDGVRRIDARVWAHSNGGQPAPGVAASLAVGLVRCDGAARIVDVRVDRGLYTAAPSAADLATRHAVYRAHAVPRAGGSEGSGANGADVLSLAVQRRLAELEVELALAWRAAGSPDDLLVVDGPLRAHATHVPRAIGYVKTHHVPYLPPPQASVVAGLAPGQRSPVFAMTTSWPRHSWYLRLAGPSTAPWSGVVRLECAADVPTAEAVALADLTARVLPPMASTPHKDPRAPQNLVPIGGLERQLRHRLGDPGLLYRSLRAAAVSS